MAVDIRVPTYALDASVDVLSVILPELDRAPSVIADAALEANRRRVLADLQADLRAAARRVDLDEAIALIVDATQRASGDPRQAFQRLARVITKLRAIPLNTAASIPELRETRSQESLIHYIEVLSCAAMARALARIDLTSHNEATRLRQTIVPIFDGAIDRASNARAEDVVRSLRSLLAVVVRDLIERGRPLSRVATYQSPVPLPSVALAHQIYQDAGRAHELVTENTPENPAFMPVDGRAYTA